MVARVFFGAVPDRLGGARTAMIFVVIQSAGIGLIWIAPIAWAGFAGAAISGFGYALVYPSFVKADRRIAFRAAGARP